MSARDYEDYARTASNYDVSRVPVGLPIIKRVLGELEAGGDGVRLLDVGCGTGAYLAALAGCAGTLTGLEVNPAMLERARRKLGAQSHVVLRQGNALSMPFGEAEFDLVLFNQVLHHLDGGAASQRGWPALRQVLGESLRVLRPGGVLLINTCSQQQLREGFWYAPLVERAVERVARRYVDTGSLKDILAGAGFERVEQWVPLDEVFYGARALDLRGPFDQAWRDGDSVWALVTPDELQAALQRIGAMIDEGRGEAFLAERERARQSVGQCVFMRATRPR
ncbi:MAG: class I SAM-dependent methyltransferase [Myxococcales bacterium]|nr:class I SAM-dependent methyltransferase [Myxococcales bacterium]